MKLKTQNIDGGVIACNSKQFVYEDSWKMRFVKNHELKKDSQIQHSKPKYRETLMKSKTQNIDGGVVTCNLKHFLYEDQWKHEICETS